MSDFETGSEKVEVERRIVAGFEVAIFEDGSSMLIGKKHNSDGYTPLERELMVSANVMRRRHEAGLLRSRRAASGKWFNEDLNGALVSITDKPMGEFSEDVELAQNILDVAVTNETTEEAHRAPDPVEPEDIGRRAIGGPGTELPMFIFKD